MPEFLRLPAERLQQLRNLATNLDMSMAEAIGVMLRHQIKEGVLEESLPGFQIRGLGKHVEFALDDGETPPLKIGSDDAKSLADSLDQIIAGKRKGHLDLDAGVEIFRVGTGIRLKANGLEKTVARDVARDVADLLRKASSNLL